MTAAGGAMIIATDARQRIATAAAIANTVTTCSKPLSV
jgi:hypothetical protein